jgi:hypothetical protein
MTAQERLVKYQQRWYKFEKSDRGKRILRILRACIFILIIIYLGNKLFQLGWQAIWDHLPMQISFYLLFLLLYFSIPVTELFLYRLFWKYDLIKNFPTFMKKRIFNTDVLGYSGEVYFFNWARENINQKEIQLAETIRDNNIISSLASTTITITLLVIFIHNGHTAIMNYLGRLDNRYYLLAILMVIILVPLILRFRKYIFSMPIKTALAVYAIQILRMSLGQVFQIAQWAVVLPSVPLATWITYAAIAILLARIPFPSNKKLIFMGVGVEIASSLGIPEAAMFSLLGTIVALNKIFNFSLFLLMTITDSKIISLPHIFTSTQNADMEVNKDREPEIKSD